MNWRITFLTLLAALSIDLGVGATRIPWAPRRALEPGQPLPTTNAGRLARGLPLLPPRQSTSHVSLLPIHTLTRFHSGHPALPCPAFGAVTWRPGHVCLLVLTAITPLTTDLDARATSEAPTRSPASSWDMSAPTRTSSESTAACRTPQLAPSRSPSRTRGSCILPSP